jgi:phosphatidylglycerophosphatase A
MNKPLAKFLLSGLGLGMIPIAPGTWGSMGCAAVYYAVAWASAGDAWTVNLAMLAVIAVASVICVTMGKFAEQVWQRKDPGHVVVDEWAGQAMTFLLVPLGGPGDWLVRAAAGFFLFRVFDIVKPPPARRIERLPFGWGVLIDDLVAAVYANIVMQLLFRVAWQ